MPTNHPIITELPVAEREDPNFIFPLESFPSEELFAEEIAYPALSVPVQHTAALRKKLSGVLLHRPRTKNVYSDPADEKRRILVLDKDKYNPDNALVVPLLQSDCTLATYSLRFTYSDHTVDEVLKKLLPSTITEVPSSFEWVGSLVHLNLRDNLLPYKFWIGKVILEKNAPRVTTVVNKVGTIETEYRTFGMEVIAGDNSEGWSVTTVKEEGCEFTLDFRQVYWNSRLSGEHKRLVQLIQQDSQTRCDKEIIVADLMAGVGPFAVPLTAAGSHYSRKRKRTEQNRITVHANDLNPASYKYLMENAKSNNCHNLHCSNQDARAFIWDLQTKISQIDHCIMNLPASAPEFLDAFRGWSLQTLPMVHVHCFAPKHKQEDDFYQEAVDRCSAALGVRLNRPDVHIHIVRDISPNKNMLCVSFRLPEAVRTFGQDMPRTEAH